MIELCALGGDTYKCSFASRGMNNLFCNKFYTAGILTAMIIILIMVIYPCKKGTPIYVGKTIYPRSRIMSHRLNKSFDNVYLFRFNNKDKYCSDADKKASRLERNLIRNFDPEMNVQYRKTKTRHLS